MKNAPTKVPDLRTPLTKEAAEIIEHLQLQPHPEGGWYREVYRSDEILPGAALPLRYKEPHAFSTSIYFMLEKGDFSAFHRISSDETWHFYMGSPLAIYIINQDSDFTRVILGNDFIQGQVLQYTVKRNCWFAADISNNGIYALVGCTVSPGFEFSDFELGQLEQLMAIYPMHSAFLRKYTRT